jgi:hypothetical protein
MITEIAVKDIIKQQTGTRNYLGGLELTLTDNHRVSGDLA